jgi:hypothetical protein
MTEMGEIEDWFGLHGLLLKRRSGTRDRAPRAWFMNTRGRHSVYFY